MKKGSKMNFLEKIYKWTKEYTECEPLYAPKNAIYIFASDLRKQILEDFATRIDMFDVIKEAGGRIHTLGLSDYMHLDGSIFIHSKGNFDIILPEYTSPVRDIFTLAHEFGHYILHSVVAGQKSKLWANRYGSGRLEWEANWFAAAFLMPKSLLDYLSSQHQLTPEILSNISGVSLDAAKIRIETYNSEHI